MDVQDGLSNTILVVSAPGAGVPWPEPRDIDVDTWVRATAEAGAKRGWGRRPGGFNVLLGDGSVRWVKTATREGALRAMASANGNEGYAAPE